MAFISGRTTMSSRGQIVIPKALREATGIAVGDTLDVVYDGDRLYLVPAGTDKSMTGSSLTSGAVGISERRADYLAPAARSEIIPQGSTSHARPSTVWADRMRALAAITKLRTEFTGIRADEILRESRLELERRAEERSE
jgi:AbrB family looped-hinge helix DNA binding protein